MTYKFTNVRPFEGNAWYWYPNEYINRYHDDLKLIPWLGTANCRGASIASGGEVPLTVMLPYCTELTIVDHCSCSLWVTCNKIEIFRHLSTDDIFKLYKERDFKYFCDLIKETEKEIPKELQGKVKLDEVLGDSPKDGDYTTWKIGGQHQWSKILPWQVDAAKEHLGNIAEVIHGDLRDLGRGYDLLYISNATGHTPYDADGYNSQHLTDSIKEIVVEGGYVLNGGSTPPGLQPVDSRKSSGILTKPKTQPPRRDRGVAYEFNPQLMPVNYHNTILRMISKIPRYRKGAA